MAQSRSGVAASNTNSFARFGTDLDRDRVPMDTEHFVKIFERDWASQRASSSSPFPNLGSVDLKSESLTRSPG